MTLPFSEPLEATIVSRLLADPSQLPLLAGSLPAADFYVETYRKAYVAMQRLSATRRTVDLESLRSLIGNRDADDVSRGLSGLTIAHRAPLEEYAQQVKDLAFRRRIIGALERVASLAEATDTSTRDDLLASLQDALSQATDGVDSGSLLSPNQAADKYERTMALRAAGQQPGLSWGLSAFDHAMLPAQGGEMIVLAARPSVGKTALAEQVSDAWAHQAPYPVLFVSLEMDSDSLLDRTVSRTSGVYGRDVIRGILTADEQARAMRAVALRREVGVWFLDDPYATTASVRAAAARVKILAGGLSGIVIDYLQLLKDPGDPEVTRVTRISRNIKAIALEFKVPVLALSQLSRAATMREDSHPRLSDLRESGAIEQDADRVLGLWRPALDAVESHVDVLKSRQGAAGIRMELDYHGANFRFDDYTPMRTKAEQADDDYDDVAGYAPGLL